VVVVGGRELFWGSAFGVGIDTSSASLHIREQNAESVHSPVGRLANLSQFMVIVAGATARSVTVTRADTSKDSLILSLMSISSRLDAVIGKATRIEVSELFSGEESYMLLDAGKITGSNYQRNVCIPSSWWTTEENRSTSWLVHGQR
jgi:hypothetical protein